MAEGVGELHLAIVVDCSPESLSEDVARGSFGRESPSTRLEALIDVARDYAASSRASAVTVLACDPSKGARVTSEKNVAVVVPPRRVTADDALFRDADRALGLVDDDGRRREVPAPPPGAPLHACLALAAMALRRCERADPRATRGTDGAPPSPTRRVLVLLASDPDSIAASSLALAPALAKLRAIGARRDVLHVAPPPRHVRASLRRREDARSTRREDDRSTLAETLQCISDDDGACFARVNGASIGRARCSPAGALTFAATTTSSDRGGEEDADERGEPAGVHLARPMDAPFTPHERPRDERPRDERPRDERSGRTPSARSLRRGLERTVSRATRRVLRDGSRGGARARDDGTRRIARGGDVRRVANPRRRRGVRTRRRRDESREGRRRRRRRSPAPETGTSSRPRRGRSGRRPEGARRVDPPDRGRSRRSNARAIGRPDHALRTRVARARPANDGHGESSSSSPSRRRFFAADARASPVRSAEGGNPGEHIRRSRGAISSGGGGRSGRENDRSRRARRSERSIGGSRETTRRRVAPRVFSHPRRGRGEKTVLLLEPGTHASRIRIGVTPTRIGTQRSAHVRGRVRGTPRTAPRARGGGAGVGARPRGSAREPRRRRREDGGGGVGERVDAHPNARKFVPTFRLV